MLALDECDYHKTTWGGSPPGPYTLFVIFHGRLGAITSQKFHCSSREHAADVLDDLDGLGVGHLECEILKGHL